MKNIWINVSSSYTWSGYPTGIIRTEIEVVTHILNNKNKKNLNIKLFLYQDGNFKEINEEEYLETITKKTDSTSQSCKEKEDSKNKSCYTVNPSYLTVVSRREAVKLAVQSLYSLLPSRLRPMFERVCFKLKKHIVKFVCTKRNQTYSVNKEHNALLKSASDNFTNDNLFVYGDCILSMGLDWDTEIYRKFWNLKRKQGIQLFLFCYDIIPVLFPQWCAVSTKNRFGDYILEIAMSADCIFCISKTTMSDLNNLLYETGCRIPKLVEIKLGENVVTDGCQCVDSGVNSDYILYVSTIENRKNHDILYKAYHRLIEKYPMKKLPKLVFVGMQGWWVGDLLHVILTDPKVKDLIVMKGAVSDEELISLYRNCLFTVFPSCYEGYGLGVVESLSYGKTCLVSTAGALREFSDRLVSYADPWDVNQWCEGLVKLLDDNVRREYEDNIRKYHQTQDWDETAVSILGAISESK